jgi:hypothetical protein
VAGGAGLTCAFVGTETVLPAEVLASRYGDVGSYIEQFTASLDDTIEAGFLLEADRARILEDAAARAEALLPAAPR